MKESIPSACLCCAVGALGAHQQRFGSLMAAALRVLWDGSGSAQLLA